MKKLCFRKRVEAREFDVKGITLNELEELVSFCNKIDRVYPFDHFEYYAFHDLCIDLRRLTKQAILTYFDEGHSSKDCHGIGLTWLCLYLASYFEEAFDGCGYMNILKSELILDYINNPTIYWDDIALLVQNVGALICYFRHRDILIDEYESIYFESDYLSDIEYYLKKYSK